ncbi:glucose-6-phosphate isomerase [Noviherbaspirillum sp. CPCC 100848]|uniref:Glucose-6-phosphate isomerase n=1 Tax=Noviherbaspirillum album TaxID=3080276 RepID=A0ABU6JBX6_9BURK|nr:glucose-6-phosphate isomerase [Noviherbaspirillum sp. CPCC 100848]MEC4721151.1 glucose-6-phosphate isomerase [Noviherbaspirillum sp. CPCC 100848]
MHQNALTETPAYQALLRHHAEASQWQLRDLFDPRQVGSGQPDRFSRYSLEAAGLFLDYSKNRIDDTTLSLLMTLARERGVEAHRDAMFSGERINNTEDRSVLHTALRAPRNSRLVVNGQDAVAEVHAVLDRMSAFVERVRSGQWRGRSGKAVTDVVNIGIGGSDLGPEMVCRALRSFAHPGLAFHFVANVDGHDLDAVLSKVNPETTLFVVASKTFTTRETMMNAQSARAWFLRTGSEADLAKHFVAVSTNTDAVRSFGIDPENMFPFWDWVGGRYSVWSAIGLPVALAIGFENFRQFLDGAHGMDLHFRSAPLERNMPVLLAMLGIWYRNFFHSGSISIAPYHQDLGQFAAYLQQLDMESNGKRVSRSGQALQAETGPVVWGDVGTNGQHAYFQLLHQGTDIVPVDFIAALKPTHALPGHHAVLLANCFAQSEAFMRGKDAGEVHAELKAQKLPDEQIAALLPHKVFPGNRPSNTILMESLTPTALGALIALYEHKVFVQGAVWNVNSFDQWGVELGKVLAKNIEPEINGAPRPEAHDSSTNGLIARARAALSS